MSANIGMNVFTAKFQSFVHKSAVQWTSFVGRSEIVGWENHHSTHSLCWWILEGRVTMPLNSNELTQSVNIGRSENVRQRRHQDPAPILQFLGLASSQSDQLLLLSSHPGDYGVSYIMRILISLGIMLMLYILKASFLTFAFSLATSLCRDSISSMKITW